MNFGDMKTEMFGIAGNAVTKKDTKRNFLLKRKMSFLSKDSKVNYLTPIKDKL
jgi:hypothetical protein